MKSLFAALLAAVALPCLAETPSTDLPVQTLEAPADLPAIVVEAEPGSESTVRQYNGETLEEFRRQGRLYKLKITPAQGPAYFLIEEVAPRDNQ